MTFTNERKYLSFDYIILSHSLPRVTIVKDFGVTLTINWNFKDPSRIVVMSLKLLRCVVLLISFAQHLPMLEYCLVIWNPWHRQNQTSSKQLIKYLLQIQSTVLHNYPALCHNFRLSSLQHHRQVADLIFLHKCVQSYYLIRPIW